ncbi:hypothetical protein NHX12_027376, partial [Muraenolepis orangiensis]
GPRGHRTRRVLIGRLAVTRREGQVHFAHENSGGVPALEVGTPSRSKRSKRC